MNARAWNETSPRHTHGADPRWRDDAACRGSDPALFYPAHGDAMAAADAKAICAGCPVAEDCLAYATATLQQHGVWGGLAPQERRALRRDTPTLTVVPPPADVDPRRSELAGRRNHDRWHVARGIHRDGCPWCESGAA